MFFVRVEYNRIFTIGQKKPTVIFCVYSMICICVHYTRFTFLYFSWLRTTFFITTVWHTNFRWWLNSINCLNFRWRLNSCLNIWRWLKRSFYNRLNPRRLLNNLNYILIRWIFNNWLLLPKFKLVIYRISIYIFFAYIVFINLHKFTFFYKFR